MKKFLLMSLAFGVTFFVIDKAFLILRHFAPNFTDDKRLEMVFESKMNKDLIIFGSSRGENDVITWMLQDSLGLDSYNLSYGGSSVEYQEYVLEMLLKYNKKPKYIIKLLDDDFELMYKDAHGNGKGFRVDALHPLVKYKDVRDELVKIGDKNGIMSNLFVLHQLSKTNYDIRPQPPLNDTLLKFGANPVNVHNSNFDWAYYNTSPIYNRKREQKIEIDKLIKFQKTCAENNITLVFATAPVYRKMSDGWCKRMKQLTLPTTHFYVHDINDERFKNMWNFGDLSHLNTKGSIIYTDGLIKYLKKAVIKK